jgi:diacylglycerol kinase
VLRNERNARIHLVFAILVLLAGLVFQVTPLELSAVVFAVIIVFLAEIFNSAFEKTLDIVSPGHHPTVKLVKDMTAGAVLFAAVGAVIIGVVVFLPHITKLFL